MSSIPVAAASTAWRPRLLWRLPRGQLEGHARAAEFTEGIVGPSTLELTGVHGKPVAALPRPERGVGWGVAVFLRFDPALGGVVSRRKVLTVCTLVMYSGLMKITATAFKAQCLRLLDQVSRTGEELVILKRGRPVARVVPARDEKPWIALRGRGEFRGDPFASVIDEADIDALQ